MMLRSVLQCKTSKNGKQHLAQPFSNRFHSIAKSLKITKSYSTFQFSQSHKLSFPQIRLYNSEAQQLEQVEEAETKSKFHKIEFEDWAPKLQKAAELEVEAKEFIQNQNYEDAEALIYSLIFIRKSHIDSTNGKLSDIAKDYLLLAYTQQNLRKNTLAEINYRLGIKLLEDKHKQTPLEIKERWNVLLQRMNYSNLLAARNNFPDAVRQVKRVLTIIEKENLKTPEYDEKYATILNNLAAYTSATGDSTEARNLTEIALDLIEKSVGVNNLLYEGTLETYLQILGDLEVTEEEIQEKVSEYEQKCATKIDNVNGKLLSDIKPSKELLSTVDRAWKRDLNYYPCDPDGFISPPAVLKAQIKEFDGSANPTLFNSICEDENESITQLLSNVERVLNRKRVVDPIERYSSLINLIPDSEVDLTPIDKYQRILAESKYPELVGVERFNETEQDFPNYSIVKESSAVDEDIDTTHLKNADIDLTGESNEAALEDDIEKDDEDLDEDFDLSKVNFKDLEVNREELEYALRNFQVNPKAFENKEDLLKAILKISEAEEKRDSKERTVSISRETPAEEARITTIPETDEGLRNYNLFKFDPEDVEDEELEELGEEYDQYLEGFDDPNVKFSDKLERMKQFIDKEVNPDDSADARAKTQRIKTKLREILNDPVVRALEQAQEETSLISTDNIKDDEMEEKFTEIYDKIDLENQRIKFAKLGIEFDPEYHSKDLVDAVLDVYDQVREIRELERLADQPQSLLGDQQKPEDPIINIEEELENFHPFTNEVLQEQREEKILSELHNVTKYDGDIVTYTDLEGLEEPQELDQEAIITQLVATNLLDASDITPEFYKSPNEYPEFSAEESLEFKEIVDKYEELAPFADPKLLDFIETSYKKLVDPSSEVRDGRRRKYYDDDLDKGPQNDVLNQEMKRSDDDELINYIPREIEKLMDKKIATDGEVDPVLVDYLDEDFFKKL